MFSFNGAFSYTTCGMETTELSVGPQSPEEKITDHSLEPLFKVQFHVPRIESADRFRG